MADGFDPSKIEPNQSSQGSTPHQAQGASVDRSLHRLPSYKSVWKRMSSTDSDKPFIPANNAASYAGQSRTPSTSGSISGPQSPSPFSVVGQLPQGSRSAIDHAEVHIIEAKPKPYWESGENSFDDWNQAHHEGSQYGSDQAASYTPEGYYIDARAYKQKGISHKIDRFVQRVPALGLFYKQPPSPADQHEIYQQFKFGQISSMGYGGQQAAPDLAAADLLLNRRYSEQSQTQAIDLQAKEQAQPVDVCVHHETSQIYVCDLGRSIVEIYDMDRTLRHVITDSTMLKFRPTAITITSDGTVIIASHFSHCLHMYSPTSSASNANQYTYKQFKLGIEGNQIHQFCQPAGITVDASDGYLYVCDRGNYRVQVFNPQGICERVIEMFLNVKKKVRIDPVRVALQNSSDQLVCITGPGDALCFIPKSSNGRIYVEPFFVLDQNGVGLENASGVAVDDQGRIFISDTGHNRVVVCAPDGTFITSFSTEGSGLGQLKRPCGLAVTHEGTVIVTDPENKRLQFFGLTSKESPVRNDRPAERVEQRSSLMVAEDESIIKL